MCFLDIEISLMVHKKRDWCLYLRKKNGSKFNLSLASRLHFIVENQRRITFLKAFECTYTNVTCFFKKVRKLTPYILTFLFVFICPWIVIFIYPPFVHIRHPKPYLWKKGPVNFCVRVVILGQTRVMNK